MKKLTAIVLAMLTICMLFTACNEKSDNTTTVVEYGPTGLVSKGYLLESSDKVRIYAPETGYSMIYCNQPGCKHEQYSENNIAPSCTAVFPEDGVLMGAFFYNEKMYMFGWDNSLLNTVFYSSNLDGTGKKKLGVVENATINHNYGLLINDGILYFPGEGRSFDGKQSTTKSVIAAIDMKTGEGEIIHEIGESQYNLFNEVYMADDYFFYLATTPETAKKITEALNKGDKEFSKTLPDGWGVLYCLNIHTGENKKLYDSGWHDFYWPLKVNIDSTFFYSRTVRDENGNAVSKQIREYNAETGEDKECRFGNISIIRRFENKIYYGLNASNEASVNYVYDVKTGKSHKLENEIDLSKVNVTSADESNLFCNANMSSGNTVMSWMTFDEFENGLTQPHIFDEQ